MTSSTASVGALPPLTADESAQETRLLARIRAEIERNGGWLSFERFMEMALYEPGLGYYSAGARKLGRDGDFVTAPEISALFSRCLARQCAQILTALGGGDVLELGAGSGAMAADMLLELAAMDVLPRRYLILEVGADLRERQRATIQARAPQLFDRVSWLDALPENLCGVIVANEVLDALPVQRFCMRGSGVQALGVSFQNDRLELSVAPADDLLTGAVRAIEQTIGRELPDGYCSEVNIRLQPWLRGVASSLQSGAMIFIDYGLPRAQYYSGERSDGTLLCHFRHRAHDDALLHVGLQDIGAWVDFTAVAEAAVECECSVLGYTTQAHFLMSCGIESLLGDFAEQDATTRIQLAQQTRTLLLPGEMGERFKVIALGKDWSEPLLGFAMRDLAATL